MFLRALFAFLACPGVVALLIPLWIVWHRRPASEPWFSIGLYRHTRNPMYVAVTLMLAGWALCAWSQALVIYTCFVIVAFHLRVVFGEEPWLARTHGNAWEEYKSKVPRWLL